MGKGRGVLACRTPTGCAGRLEPRQARERLHLGSGKRQWNQESILPLLHLSLLLPEISAEERQSLGPPGAGRAWKHRGHLPGHLGQHWLGVLSGLEQLMGGQGSGEQCTVPSWEQREGAGGGLRQGRWQ